MKYLLCIAIVGAGAAVAIVLKDALVFLLSCIVSVAVKEGL